MKRQCINILITGSRLDEMGNSEIFKIAKRNGTCDGYQNNKNVMLIVMLGIYQKVNGCAVKGKNTVLLDLR